MTDKAIPGMPENRPNWRYLGGGLYLVRTQAGFKQALKSWLEEHEYHYDGVTYREFNGYPKSYPSVVSFEYDYHRSGRKEAYCQPLHEYADSLRARLADLEADL